MILSKYSAAFTSVKCKMARGCQNLGGAKHFDMKTSIVPIVIPSPLVFKAKTKARCQGKDITCYVAFYGQEKSVKAKVFKG